MSQPSYQFIHGDCVDILKKQPDNSIDCVVTSPPYNIGINYSTYSDRKSRNQYLQWIHSIFVEIKRVLKPNGHIFLNMGYTNIDPWISMEVAFKLKDLFVLQNKITWVKSISIGSHSDDTYGHFKPINSKRYISPTNEDIYHFTIDGKQPVDRLSIGVPYKDKNNLKERKKKINKTGKLKPDKRCKGNSWFIPYKTVSNRREKGYHPATFPVELAEHCILLSGKRNGIILDPFCGTGTTMRAIKNINTITEGCNISGIGIDIDETYLQYAKNTMEE